MSAIEKNNVRFESSSINNNNTYAIHPQHAQIQKATLTLFVERSISQPIPKSDRIANIITYVPAPSENQQILNSSWTSIAKEINNFIANSFKGKTDGYRIITNVFGTYKGIVSNKLPANGCMILPSGTFHGFFLDGIPQYYGHIITKDLELEGPFNKGNPTGICQITFNYHTQNKHVIQCSSNQQPINEPADIDLKLQINEFFSNCDQPLSNGQKVLKNKYGYFKGVISEGSPVTGSLHLKEVVYEGSFSNKLPHGKGLLKTAKSTYSGDFFQGNKHGHGKLWLINGRDYKGEFKNDVYDGYGELKLASSNIYEGDFVNSKRQGFGHYFLENGDLHAGYWDNDKRNGTGTYFFLNGCELKSTWVDNKISGPGILTFINGDVLEGNWVENIQRPHGTIRYSNGDVYTGGCLNGQRHGHGTMKYADGRVETFVWENNQIALVQDSSISSSELDKVPPNTNLNKKIKVFEDNSMANHNTDLD